jgi:polyisoprenoid-binding protein YceI
MMMMTNKNTLFIGMAALLLVIAAGAGLWAYEALLGDAEAASGAMTAVPLAVSTATPQPALAAVETTAEPSTSTTETSAETTSANPASDSNQVIFEISQDASEVSFSIYEELAGQPKTVVGVTDQVAGQIAIHLNDLSQSQIGVIQVNARTFVTDSDRRNNAIRNFILTTDQYEFITFTPTEIIGLSGSAEAGQPFTFQIAGDLTIRNITQPVVFDVTVQGDTASLTGTATTVVNRSDYNLTIPSVPNVANVGEEVTLQINFVATAAS